MNGPASVPVRWHGAAALSVTLHDVAPATQPRCEQLIGALERIAPLQLTLLVVPFYRHQRSSAAFERWLQARVRRGDELALHGLTHCDEGPPPRGWVDHARRHWYTDREGEFAALEAPEAGRRMQAGRHWFARRGWPLHGFVAPAWLLGDGAWSALLRQPFDYTCTRTALLALPRGAPHEPMRTLPGRSIVYSTRTAWRRALSQRWNAWVAHDARARAWMRVELHPGDAEHRALCDAALALVGRALADQRECLTLAAIAARLRAAAPLDTHGPRPDALDARGGSGAE